MMYGDQSKPDTYRDTHTFCSVQDTHKSTSHMTLEEAIRSMHHSASAAGASRGGPGSKQGKCWSTLSTPAMGYAEPRGATPALSYAEPRSMVPLLHVDTSMTELSIS